MVCARRGLIYSGLSVCVCVNARTVGLVKYVNISGMRATATPDVMPSYNVDVWQNDEGG